MMMVKGWHARNRRLFAAKRCTRVEGGVYWTSDKENKGGRADDATRLEGI
jgi:hypothetical protein